MREKSREVHDRVLGRSIGSGMKAVILNKFRKVEGGSG